MSLVENDEPGLSETQPNKLRRRSVVWEHFTVETVGAGCIRACCKQCKQTFAYSTGSKLAGTSHLKRHIALGTCLVNRRKKRNQLAAHTPPVYRVGGNGSASDLSRKPDRGSLPVDFPFDQDLCRQELAKMIIMHEYPLDMVEHRAFLSFVHNLQPQFNMVSFETIQGDCMAIYHREKEELVKVMGGISGRVSLSVDLWTSSQTLGYVLLTAHFINNGWKLQRRILNVVVIPSCHSKDALSHAVGMCIHDWGLESKLFSITLNTCLLSDDAGSFRGYLSVRNPFILNGQLLVEYCYAHVLSCIALDALGGMHETVDKVRESIKYMKTLQTLENEFLNLKEKLQIHSTTQISLDDQTQWNTTYLMLVAALELKEVFSCLEVADPDYQLALSIDDWQQVEILCACLKLLYDAANILLTTVQLTADVYFHEALKIQLELLEGAESQDPLICNLIRPLKEKFDTYWKNCSLFLAIAVVMDPRFKMKFVELSFSKVYGDDARTYIKVVDAGIHELFSVYAMQSLPLGPNCYIVQGNISNVKTEPSFQAMLELDMYLEGTLVPHTQEFDILSWWKLNDHKYPTLCKMARDILCIPMSTVGSESFFDTEFRQLDSYRSSLQPEMLEALICTKDWLLSGSAEAKNALVKMEISML